MAPCECNPVGTLLILDLKREASPKFLCPVAFPAVVLGAGDLEVDDPDELGFGGGAQLRGRDGGER